MIPSFLRLQEALKIPRGRVVISGVKYNWFQGSFAVPAEISSFSKKDGRHHTFNCRYILVSTALPLLKNVSTAVNPQDQPALAQL